SPPPRKPPTPPTPSSVPPANAPTPSSRPGASCASSAAAPGAPGNSPKPSTSSRPARWPDEKRSLALRLILRVRQGTSSAVGVCPCVSCPGALLGNSCYYHPSTAPLPNAYLFRLLH